MALKPHVQSFLEATGGTLRLARGASPHDPDGRRFLAELRDGGGSRRSVAAAGLPELGRLWDDAAAGRVPVRIYLAAGGDPCGAVVYAHGGGWVSGDLEMHDPTCRRLAAAAGCAIVSVDYRLAPEHPFPAALEDVLVALRWTAREAREWGVADGAIAIAGTSAGANLAAGAAVLAREQGVSLLAAQVLVYPILDATMSLPSMELFGEARFLTAEQIRFYWDCYVPSVFERSRPEVSPLRASSLDGLPRALIVTAEQDPLRDEGEAFAHRLSDEGAGAELLRVDGQIHGFLSAFAGSAEAAATIDWIAAGLRDALLRSPVL